MTTIRSEITDYVSQYHEEWSQLLAIIYVLAQKDRIGQFGINERSGVPGIWGHSYVRTYYMWVNSPPSDVARMEGGIATTFYVIKALSVFLERAGLRWQQSVISDITTFFANRTTPTGIGVVTIDPRGIEKIATHLRHTCFGFLTMCELAASHDVPGKLKQAIQMAAQAIVTPIGRDELLEEWITESWPIGGIAAYIAARDHLYRSPYGNHWVPRERRIWLDVRERLLDALAQLSSTRLDLLGLAKEKGTRRLDEHYPFWHPIKDRPVLRLHSTVGCLDLVGRELSKLDVGQVRIKEIVEILRQQVLLAPDRAPRFDTSSPPSFAAACAMLKIMLGPWYEPEPGDRDFLFAILDFLRMRWNDPEVYTDYWSEFSTPLLSIGELLGGVNLPMVADQANRALAWLDMNMGLTVPSSAIKIDKNLLESLLRIMPVALSRH